MSYVKLPKLNKLITNVNYNTKNVHELIENKSDEAIIYEAIHVGYLLYPSKEFIWEIFKKQADFDPINTQKLVKKPNKFTKYFLNESYENDYSKILFLNMTKIPLIEIGDIFMCRNIRILNLSNNYLINIEPLSECVHLLRLDLQNNQIEKLPDDEFWSNITNLRILFLHNNPIGRLEYLKHLSFCPSLEILTLYDSPICLKNNYRHHAVNSIITLKALDEYVISDEEIIEEAKFNNMYSAKSANFRINFSILSNQENTYKSELKCSLELIRHVNKILSRNSPVLILQRYVKGFLVRKKFRKILVEKKL